MGSLALLRRASSSHSSHPSLLRPFTSFLSSSHTFCADFSPLNEHRRHFNSTRKNRAEETAISATPSIRTNLHPLFLEPYNRARQLLVLNHMEPDVAVDAYVAPSANIIGDVTIADGASVWDKCVLRGDVNAIRVGFHSAILDGTVIHVATKTDVGLSSETIIGRYVTVGARSVLRSCEIEDETLIGERCLVMEGTLVEKHSVLLPGSILLPGGRIPSGQLWAGNPAKFVRNLSDEEISEIKNVAEGVNFSGRKQASEYLPYGSAYVEAEKVKVLFYEGLKSN